MVLYRDEVKRTIEKTDGAKEEEKIIDGVKFPISECVQISGKWYSKSNPSVLKDHETGEYFCDKVRGRRVYGIVGIENDNVVYGFFTPTLSKNVRFIDDKQQSEVIVIDETIFEGNKNFMENISEGIWYYYPKITSEIFKKNKSIYNAHDWTVKKYNIEENVLEFSQKTVTYKDFPHNISDMNKRYAKFLRYTFGYEFEVQRGFVPNHMQYRHGIIPCRDGSINGGGEYVTIPKEGAKGLSSLENLCEYMKTRVGLDIHCSTHLHLGGYPVDKHKIVALYLLCYKIQEDIFDMLPPYKRYWEGFKKKNYCKELDCFGISIPKKLDKNSFKAYLDDGYGKIFSFLSDFKQEIHNYSPGDRHPSGHKWDIENRKCWVNFINMFYSSRHTIEFRPHQATFNPVKVVNWLFICNAILMYADVFSNEILTENKRITLKDVLSVYFTLNKEDRDADFLSTYLIEFVESRKKEFAKSFAEKDFPCEWDLEDDKKYDFRLNGKNLFM